jgi:hypothetical protein
LVKAPNWRRFCCFFRRSDTRHEPVVPAFSLRGHGASARRHGPARTLTAASMAPFPMIKLYSWHPTVDLFCLPPRRRRHRGLPRTWAFTRRGCVWCPVRQNETRSVHWRTRANALNARTACIFSGKTEIRECIRRPTETQFCVTFGDAAIAACQARVRDVLELTQLLDDSFC